jgi:hypothetical protein
MANPNGRMTTVEDIAQAIVTLSGTGFIGPNPRYASNPADPDPTIDIANPIPVDFQVTLNANDATDYVCTPKLVQGDKILNSPGGAGGVASVNGDSGPDVTITAASINALDINFAGFPLVKFNIATGNYNERNLGSSDDPHLYYGANNPTDPLYDNPDVPFRAGIDVWLQQA